MAYWSIGGILGTPLVWNYFLAPHLLLNIIVVVQRIITVRDRTLATANLSPWPLLLSATTTKTKNQTLAIKGKTAEASKDLDKS